MSDSYEDGYITTLPVAVAAWIKNTVTKVSFKFYSLIFMVKSLSKLF